MSNKTKRKGIPKKSRFEVLKRDSFKCQYCGSAAPDVVLHIDHIRPVSKGGDNDIMNLITSCQDCNLGKGARELSDGTALAKQKQQLDDLNEKREQLEMMIQWRESLQEIQSDAVELVMSEINKKLGGFSVNENGKGLVAQWVNKFGAAVVLENIDKAADRFLTQGVDDAEEFERFFNAIPRHCAYSIMPQDKQRTCYIKGIVRNRMYLNEKVFHVVVKDAVAAGIEFDEIEDLAKTAKNWTEFKNILIRAVEMSLEAEGEAV